MWHDATARALDSFRNEALADRREDLLANFPTALAENGLSMSWRAPASRIYRNWLTYINARKSRQLAAAISDVESSPTAWVTCRSPRSLSGARSRAGTRVTFG